MRVSSVVVFNLVVIFAYSDAQMFGGLATQLQVAQMQQAQRQQAMLQQAQLQQAQLQQAQLQQAQLQQAQLQQSALLQQQMGLSGQQQGLPEDDDEKRHGKGFGGFGFGRFRPFFGFNPFFPGFGGGFGGFGPGFGGFGGLGGLGGFGGLGPFGMFGRSTAQTPNGLSGNGLSAGGVAGGNAASQQSNQQLQQFMDQMNERFTQREQDFERMKDDFLIELGQKLKEQYGNQVTEAEVQLYLKNVGEQLRTMYGQPKANPESSKDQSEGNSGSQKKESASRSTTGSLRNPFRQAQDPQTKSGRPASSTQEQNKPQKRTSFSSN